MASVFKTMKLLADTCNANLVERANEFPLVPGASYMLHIELPDNVKASANQRSENRIRSFLNKTFLYKVIDQFAYSYDATLIKPNADTERQDGIYVRIDVMRTCLYGFSPMRLTRILKDAFEKFALVEIPLFSTVLLEILSEAESSIERRETPDTVIDRYYWIDDLNKLAKAPYMEVLQYFADTFDILTADLLPADYYEALERFELERSENAPAVDVDEIYTYSLGLRGMQKLHIEGYPVDCTFIHGNKHSNIKPDGTSAFSMFVIFDNSTTMEEVSVPAMGTELPTVSIIIDDIRKTFA
jgi:hypothetical protein